MAMIRCPECGRQMSDKAVMCPSCGVPIDYVNELLEQQKLEEESHSSDDEPSSSAFASSVPAVEKKTELRGFVFLMLAAALSAFYLCFRLPLWFAASAGGFELPLVIEAIRQDLTLQSIIPHLLTGIAALLFNLIGLFSISGGISLLAALLYTGSSVLMYLWERCFDYYLILTGASALLCLIAFIRIRSGNSQL